MNATPRYARMLLRVVMFFLIGALVERLMLASGADPALLPWIFVSSGLGAALAVDFFLWLQRKE